MQLHGPKRVYTPQSLESWFSRLEADWSGHFSALQLDAGRRIYRGSEVREIELSHNDAIIHRRVDKRDEYVVLEWLDGAFSVRSSTGDADGARALAVAGLHEIEELICDELSPVAPPPADATTVQTDAARAPAPADRAAPSTAETVRANGNGHAPAQRAAANGNGAHHTANGNGVGESSPPASAAAPARKLLLSFATQIDGLSFQAFWLNDADAGAPEPRVSALGQSAAITTAERAKLIALAANARKAHFAYDQKSGAYLLPAIVEIPDFLKFTLPGWRRTFEIELDANVEKLLCGPRVIDIEAVAGRRARARTDGQNGAAAAHDLDVALDLRWIFKAGENLLSEDDIALVAKRGASPTLLPGVGIVTLPAERLDTLKTWQRNIAETQAPDGALPPYLVFSLFNEARLKLSLSPEIEAWRQSVLAPASGPRALPEVLRPYQRRGVEWLHHLCDTGCHGLLADEMGLGKTLQIIALLGSRGDADARTVENHPPSRPSLIVCPASVVPVWQEEFAKFSPATRIEVLKSDNDFAMHHLNGSGRGIVWVSSYAQLRKHRALLENTGFAYAVLDEGQFIKNPDAKTTQTCFSIRAAHRIVLSGTPLENRQLDLWSIFRFLLPGLLGTRSGFEAALGADREGMLARLRAQLAPFILRRTKSEVASELPQKIEMELVCPLTDMQRTEYARVCAEGLQRLGDDTGAALREHSFGFLALLTRLRQICCDPDMLPWLKAPLSDSGKINLLVQKLAEIISGGHKVVIFSQFVMFLDRVREALTHAYPDLPLYEITGMTLDRSKPVQEFQTAKGAAAMLVSLKAGGTGITLHAADYIFLLDPWWNPAVEAQAVDRVHRIGQTSTVFVYRMVTAGTIEERIQALKETKRGLFDKLVGGMDGDFDLGRHFSSLHELVQLTSAEVVESEPAQEHAVI